MKRRLLSVVAIMVPIILMLTGCAGDTLKIGEKIDMQIDDYPGVSMQIVDGTLTETGTTIRVTNGTGKEIGTGNRYSSVPA